MTNFVDFGLDPDCETLEIFGTGPDLDSFNGQELCNFCH